jgi:RNA polymerase sigma factor (sigma-70 family)
MSDDPREPDTEVPDPRDPLGEGGEISDATRELVERAQAGEVEALDELFTRYYDLMVEQARRRLGGKLRSKEEPDDLAQTTFREAHRDFGSYTYRGEGSLLRWLIQILQNKIRDRAEFYSARKRDVDRERSMELGSPGSGDEVFRLDPEAGDLTVTRQVRRKEEEELIQDALGRLSEDHREAITRVFFGGQTLRQAGESMGGRSEDAVRMLLRRAEARLRDILAGKLGGSGEEAEE